ncbi:MmcB family DNA repair protein [Raoultella ornithinolytica]|uniref:MmcB family DNA repair protein n=1 Tax=Raoultella ornithinolytica TaxID=54291 RepID=UPI002FF5B3C1
MKWTHNTLAHDLAEHLRQNTSRKVWEDMQLGPSGTARPDVYALPHSYSKFCPVAYEVKVSVDDFRADVTHGKFTKYFMYASAVVFAVPEGMLKKTDIPEGCGLMIRKESGWHTLKGPTIRPIDNIPRDAWIKLVMDGVRREGERIRLTARSGSIYDTEQCLRKRHGDKIAQLVTRAYQSAEMLQSAIEQQEARRKSVHEQTEDESRRRREERERREEYLSSSQTELAVTLGLSADATVYQLINAINSASRRLAQDSEIRRLRQIIAHIEKSLSEAMQKLPGENAA